MPTAKIAVTIDRNLVDRLDQLVVARRFPSRSRAVQEALRAKLDQLDRGRLARECAKLDPRAEQQLADEGLAQEVEQWPVDGEATVQTFLGQDQPNPHAVDPSDRQEDHAPDRR